MRPPHITAPGILLSAITLLATATGLAIARDNSWLAGLLAGAGSIVLGVWVGVAVTQPPGLIMRRHEGREEKE